MRTKRIRHAWIKTTTWSKSFKAARQYKWWSAVMSATFTVNWMGSELRSDSKGDKGNLLNQLVDIISSIFTPFLGARCRGLKGFLTLAVTLNWLAADSGVYTVLCDCRWVVYLFTSDVGFYCSEKFRTNEFLAVSLAMALVHPDITALAGQTLSFLGLRSLLVLVLYVFSHSDYFSGLLQSYVERFFKKSFLASYRSSVYL